MISIKVTYYEDGSIEGDMLYIRIPVCEKYCGSCDFNRHSYGKVVPVMGIG